jgi:sortase (surface protein transpeptidase)
MNRLKPSTGGRRGVPTMLTLAAAVAGVLLIGFALASQQQAADAPSSTAGGPSSPSPPSAQAPSVQESLAPTPDARDDDTTTGGSARSAKPAGGSPLPPSQPRSIRIPAIDVRSAVFPIGKNDQGALRVPQPGPNLDKAAWYRESPTPGQLGPSVIEGHVDTERGPSVFFRLGDVRPGDRIEVARADGTTAVFTVDRLREFAKTRFPTKLVYGGNLSRPTLRLVTCANFNEGVGEHIANLIVFAHLTTVRGQS